MRKGHTQSRERASSSGSCEAARAMAAAGYAHRVRPPAFASSGRSFRGNLHTHSDRSDGMASPAQVLAEYRAAGYDFLVLTDHFEARWDWRITDTSAARDE